MYYPFCVEPRKLNNAIRFLETFLELKPGVIHVNLTVRVNLTKQESQRAQLEIYFIGCLS